MSICSKLFTRPIRTYYTGRHSEYIFKPVAYPASQMLERVNLYIHIPFCNNGCPYCPYNKIDYDIKLVQPYVESLLNEIKLYSDRYGKFAISSVYIGGGTPALLIQELAVVLGALRSTFSLDGDICIELNPNDINEDVIARLKSIGAQLVSVGVQSFKDKNLKFIGRRYCSSDLNEKIRNVVRAGFKSINLDMMFALPTQTIEDLRDDLKEAISLGANQITTYPLFTFPYSTIGKYLRLKRVRMPALNARKEMYYFINDYLLDNGFNRVSVWGFKKGDVPRYSSVTRDNYIGLGAGAGSHLPDGFYLNTFSVADYVKRCQKKEFPTALFMDFSVDMQNYFWLYWRFYDTLIPKAELRSRFGKNQSKPLQLFKVLKFLNMIDDEKDYFRLNQRGAFWAHLLQNYFSLSYINKVWAVAMNKSFPDEISL